MHLASLHFQYFGQRNKDWYGSVRIIKQKLLIYLKSIIDSSKRELFWTLTINSSDMHLPWRQSSSKIPILGCLWSGKFCAFCSLYKKVGMKDMCHSSIKWEIYFSRWTHYQNLWNLTGNSRLTQQNL